MNGVHDAIGLAYSLVLPPFLGMLGFLALARDRFLSGLLLCVFASFAVVLGWQAIHGFWPALVSPARTHALWLWPFSALSVGVLLYRDRHMRYIRTTFESLLVLGSGAILLAALLSMPVFLADALPPGS